MTLTPIQQRAVDLRQLGVWPIPIPLREKIPTIKEWPALRIDVADVPRWFAGELNVGAILGDASDGWVDVDLDCDEARRLAPAILPPTRTFGRATSRASHYEYRSRGARFERFNAPDRGTLLELRANTSETTGAVYTVMPGSVHKETGELVEWESQAAPAEIPAEQLRTACARLAAAALLARSGWTDDQALAFAAAPRPLRAAELDTKVIERLARWLGLSAPPAKQQRKPRAPLASLDAAVRRWNDDHPADWPRHSSRCPVCGASASFGHLPTDAARWYCFSTQHPDDVGLAGSQGHHGDALDLEAHARGLKPVDVLRADGYLPAATAPAPPERFDDAPPITEGDLALAEPVTSIVEARPGLLRNNSYLTVLTIVRGNLRNVLGPDARVEFDEMAGRVTLNRDPIRDVDESRTRAEIERCFAGGVDKNGNQTGMSQKPSDIRAALVQVAQERPFHPVREYLAGIVWDGVARLDAVAEEILGAARTVLNQALVRRYLVSAVARAMEPGCKVDTALILVGKTGIGKSTFFRALAEPWFLDTMLDVTTAKALMTLRRAWIYEWAELEVMRRAEDINVVKAWISSPTDEYVPQYGHHAVEVPRGFVIAGTTESEEFLVDEKGNRRFWPLKVAAVDVDALLAQRDQLWAEAKHIYDAWSSAGKRRECTPWVLSQEEDAELDTVHAEYQESDSWTDLVVSWAERQLNVEFTTADVLETVLAKPRGQRNRSDDMRVAKILKRAGWRLGPKPKWRSKPWVRR